MKRYPLALAAGLLVVGTLFAWWMAQRTDRGMRQDLLGRVRLVAGAIDIRHIQALSGTEADLGSADYLRLKEQFASAKKAHDKCRFIYLMGRRADGAVFFFVDNEPVGSKDEAPAGMLYDDVPDGFRQIFDTRQADTEGPYTDQWGTFISGAVPLNDPNTGELIAMLAMDINAGTWKWDIAAGSALPVGIMLVLLIVLASWIAAVRSEGKASLKPIRRRLLIPLASTLLLLVGGFGAAFLHLEREDLKQSSLEKLAAASSHLKHSLLDQSKMLAALEDALVHEATLIDALKAQDRDRLLAEYEPLFTRLRTEYGITHFHFQRPDRVNLLRVHQPGRAGDLIGRFTTLEAERTKQTASGIELGPLGTFTLRVVRPVFDGDTLIGYLELGKEIEDILEDIAEEHGLELTVAIQKSLLDRTQWEAGMKMLGREPDWDRFPNDVLTYSSLPLFPPECDHSVDESGHTDHVAAEAAFNGKLWRVLSDPLRDVSGAEVGDLIILHDISAAKAAFQQTLIVSVGGALVLLAALLGFLYVLLLRTDQGIRAQQEDLQASEEQYRSTLNELPVGVVVHASDTSIVLSNPEATNILGLTFEQMAGKTVVDPAWTFVYEDSTIMKVKDYPVSKVFSTKKPLRDYLLGVRGPDRDHITWVLVNAMPTFANDGEVEQVVVNVMDITERKRAEEALKEAEQRWIALTNNTDDIIQVLDTDGNIQYMNNVYPPHTLEDVVGKPVFDFMDPNSAEVAKSTIDVLLDTQKPQQMDIVINAGDNRIDFSVKYVPDVSKGKVNRLFVLASDVTERKRADESRATALDEASRMNRLMSGREMRVIEMKKETNALLNELGRHAKYGSVEQ